MSSYEEDDPGLDDIFGTLYPDNSFLEHGDSPFGEQVPLHDDNNVGNELDYSYYNNETSLSVPMREYAPDAPSLSPMPTYQMQSYDMPQETQINAQGYNSFEQPVGVINGEYTVPIDDQPLQQPLLDTHSQYTYADEIPSTSGHQPAPSTSSRHHTTPPPRSQPSARNSSHNSNRNRPLQPKPGNHSNNRRRTGGGGGGQNDPNANQMAAGQRLEIRVDESASARIGAIAAEIKVLEEQQKQGICNNTDAINALQAQLLQLFNLPQDFVQAAPVAAPAARPIQSRPSRPSNSRRQYEAPDSPTYQPQIAMMTPSTSQATVYSDYPPAQPQQVVVQHATPVQQGHPQQGHIIRVQQGGQQQHVQVSGAQQVLYVQQTSTGQQYIQTSQQSRTYVTTAPQPIQPKPPQRNVQIAKVVLKPPASVAPPMTAHIIPRQSQVPSHHQPPPVQVQRQQPHHVVVQQQQPMVSFQPIRQPGTQIVQFAAERKHARRHRLNECFANLSQGVEYPETEKPFKDMGDVIKRLVAYHSFHEPDLKEDELDNIDANLLRAQINQGTKMEELKGKLMKAFYQEPQVVNPPEEQNLLLYLDTEYERRKLEDDREVATISREEFVRNSPLIPVLRGKDVKRPTPLPNPPKLNNQYEYYPFNDTSNGPHMLSPVMSPYLLSPTSSNRSESPMKATFHSPRLRQRSVTNYNEDIEVPEMKPMLPIKAADKKAATEQRRMAEKKEREREAKEAAQQRRQEQQRAVSIKPEPADSGYEKPVKPAAPSKPAPVKVGKVVKTKEEPEPSSSTYTPQPVKNLPRSKMFLNRARNEVPLALRSPPAQMLRPPVGRTSNGMDSDGSVSPELGDYGELGPPPRTTPTVSNDIKSSPLKKLAPLPAPQPTKTETSSVKVKAEEQSRPVFKPQVPRPTVKAETKENKPFPAKEEQAQVVPAPAQNGIRPIKLKFRLGGDVITVSGADDEEKARRKEEKRRKKELKKEKRGRHEKKREEKHRKRMLEEAGPSREPSETPAPSREINGGYEVVRTGGLKLTFKKNTSRTSTPAIPQETASLTMASTSRVNGYVLPEANTDAPPPKVPKLKIRIGPPKAVPEAVAPVSRPMPPLPELPNGPSNIFSLKPEEQGDLPAVTFSDQSDGDEELMRATDETMRSWGMSFQAPPPTVPAWPSRP